MSFVELGPDGWPVEGTLADDQSDLGIVIETALVLQQYDFDLLPDMPALNELRARDQWVSWHYVDREGSSKPTKPPINARTGGGASHSNPATWSTFAEAVEHTYRRNLPGVGYVISEDDGYTGYDLDNCIDEDTGAPLPWAQEIINLAETYTEISPSGTGVRLIARGKIGKTIKVDAADVEAYRAQRFLTITGNHISTTPTAIQPAPRTHEMLLARVAEFDARKAERLQAKELLPAEREPSAPPLRPVPTAKGDFFRNVNDAAFGNLDVWVPKMFPGARRQASTQGYRITSKQLGRDLQEDLSITPLGAEDFGLEETRTAIDLVIEYKFADDVVSAALWLCDRLGVPPEILGYGDDDDELIRLGDAFVASLEKWTRSEDGSWISAETGEISDVVPIALALKPTPYSKRAPKDIPLRRWLYGTHLVRQFLSTTVAPGGLGKSSMSIAEAICLATGRALLGDKVYERCRVWYINAEDPMDELDRRIAATCKEFEIDPNELDGWLYVDSGRDTKIVIATEERSGLKVHRPIMEQLEAAIRLYQIDVVIIDPFVKIHRVNENDNGKIDTICEELSHLADRCNCAIELVHHVRKSNDSKSGTLSVEDARGAGALIGAVRSARVLNRMSEEEASKQGVRGVERLRLFRVDNGKSNLAPPSGMATWRQLKSVSLGNGKVTRFMDEEAFHDTSDQVAVVVPYTPTQPDADLTDEQVQEIQSLCILGEHRYDRRSESWIGKVIGGVLDLDTTIDEVRKSVAVIVDIGIKDGWLEIVEAPDAGRKLRKFVKAGARTRA